MRQLPLPIAPQARPGFDNFVPGANAPALEHLRALARAAGPGAPVYLWGPSGSGKTHLLRALADERLRQGDDVACFDATTPVPWTLPAGATLAVIDDCHELDATRQHAAFALFVDAGVAQIAAAGRLPPVDLPVREDLRTRLGWGHVFALQPLGDTELAGVLRLHASTRGLRLGDEVVAYLLTRFERDPKHLLALFERLDAFALAEHRPQLTVPLLKRMLADPGEARCG